MLSFSWQAQGRTGIVKLIFFKKIFNKFLLKKKVQLYDWSFVLCLPAKPKRRVDDVVHWPATIERQVGFLLCLPAKPKRKVDDVVHWPATIERQVGFILCLPPERKRNVDDVATASILRLFSPIPAAMHYSISKVTCSGHNCNMTVSHFGSKTPSKLPDTCMYLGSKRTTYCC